MNRVRESVWQREREREREGYRDTERHRQRVCLIVLLLQYKDL